MLGLREAKGGNCCYPDYEVGPLDVPRRCHSHSAAWHMQILLRASAVAWRGHISREIRGVPCPHGHQTLTFFLRKGRSVQGTCSVSVIPLSLEGVFCCNCFFNAHCDLYPKFQMPFFPPWICTSFSSLWSAIQMCFQAHENTNQLEVSQLKCTCKFATYSNKSLGSPWFLWQNEERIKKDPNSFGSLYPDAFSYFSFT